MKIIKLNNTKYYLSVDVKKTYPELFKRCKKIRDIIHIRKLKEKNYCYAYIKNKKENIWIESNDKYNKAKLLLTVTYIDEVINESDNETSESASSEDEKEEIKEAPSLLKLTKEEQFKDENGECLKIEVRGIRDPNKCFFKVADVAKAFEIPQINKLLYGKNYINGKDYAIFIEGIEYQKNISNKKFMYLTYSGLLHVLYSCHSGIVDHFRKWATEQLFTIQMGTKEHKQKLVSKILGVSPEIVLAFLSTSIQIPCIYLFTLGTVGELRASMNISDDYDDDALIVKYGRTDDLHRRTTEHRADFCKIKGINLNLKQYHYIDPTHASKAEKELKDYFKQLKIKFTYELFEELVVIDYKSLNTIIKEKLNDIGSKYGGIIQNINLQLQLLTHNHEKELLKKDNIIGKKKLIIANKEFENYKLKNQMEQLKKKYESDSFSDED
jgi:predicted GIY-YIG superfamily endonuclease